MSSNPPIRLSRRALLRLCAATSADLLLEACAPAAQQAAAPAAATTAAPSVTSSPSQSPTSMPLDTSTPSPTSTPTATASATPTATATPIPATATPAPTETPQPTNTPDARARLRDYLKGREAQAAIAEYAAAMNLKAASVLADLRTATLKATDGRNLNLSVAEDGTPLFIADSRAREGWRETRLRDMAGACGIDVGVLIESDTERFLPEFNSGFAYVRWDYENNERDTKWRLGLAQKAGLKRIICGNLVWAQPTEGILPADIRSGKYSEDELTKIIQDHVSSFMAKFRGRIARYMVVNEPYRPPDRPNDVFWKTIGPEYIDIAFQAARSADPKAELIYNDVQNDTSNGRMTSLTQEVVAK